jgi:hypothetical protein
MKRIELSDMLVALRKELRQAQRKGDRESLRFKIETIEVEAQVTVSFEGEAKGEAKWKFWIFSEAALKASAKRVREDVQTVRLTLVPEQDGAPLKVARYGRRPQRLDSGDHG